MSQVNFYCRGCPYVFRVFGDDEEIRELTERWYECPACKKRLESGFGKPPGVLYSSDDLSPKEFLDYVNGLGLPDETVTHVEPVMAMLKSSPIEQVKAHERDERLIIQWVRLENGVTLHFAATGHGATIYKATRRKRCQ